MDLHNAVKGLLSWAAKNRYDIRVTYDKNSVRVWQYGGAGAFTDLDLGFAFASDLDSRGLGRLKRQVSREIKAIRAELGSRFAAL